MNPLNRRASITAAFGALALLGSQAPAEALIIEETFNDMAHGQYVGVNRYAPEVQIRGYNHDDGDSRLFEEGRRTIVGFDTNTSAADARANGGDDDLTFRGQWAAGNIRNENLGTSLIIEENVRDANNDGRDDDPDDDARGGRIRFDFGQEIDQVGFDIIDFQSGEVPNSFVQAFTLDGGFQWLGNAISFSDFVGRDGAVYGDRSANRIAPILADEFLTGLASFQGIVVTFGGSGSIDTLRYSTFGTSPGSAVPEPGTLMLTGVGLLYGARKRRKAAQEA